MPISELAKAIRDTREEATVEVSGLDGVRQLYGISLLYAEPDDTRTHIVVGMPADTAYAPVNAIIRHNIGIAVFFVALLMAIA